MTFASDLTAVQQHSIDATLVIDGIPVLFGTRAGLVYPTSGGGITNPPSAGLTSVAAILPGSLKFDAIRLDYDTMMVAPTSGSLKIRMDATWDAYFMRRTATQAELTADATESVTSLTVDNNGAFPTNVPVYCNRETMLLASVIGSTTLTLDATLGRNYCALAISQKAAHKTGAIVSLAPRHFLGRMAELRIYLGGDRNVNTVAKLLIFSKSPTYNRATNTWDLEFDDAMRIYDRKIAIGFKGTDVTLGAMTTVALGDSTTAYVIPLTPNETREFDTSEELGHLMVWGPNGPPDLIKIHDFSGTTPRVRWDNFLSYSGNAGTTDGYGLRVDRMRRCCVLQGQPMLGALQVLLSDRGKLLNHGTYDKLFGITSTGDNLANRLETGETECRFGAAIPQALIDITALEAFLPETVPGWFYVLGPDAGVSLLDFMEEVAWALRGFWYITPAGKLSFKKFTGEPNATTYGAAKTVAESDWLRNTSLVSVDDESSIIHTVSMKCNYDHFAGQFTVTVNAIYEQERETYRETKGTIKIERKGLVVRYDAAPPINRGLEGSQAGIALDPNLRIQLDRIFVKRARGTRRYVFNLPLKYMALQPGDRVSITSSQHVDFTTATATLSAFIGEVVSVKFDISDKTSAPVTIEVEETWADKRVSPTLQIASWNAGTLTATLKTASKWESAPGTTAELWFAIGWKARLYDYSDRANGTTSSPHTVTALDSGLHTITLATAPVWVPAVDDLIVQAHYDDANNTTTNGAQALNQRDYAFQGSATGLLGTSNAAGDVWG